MGDVEGALLEINTTGHGSTHHDKIILELNVDKDVMDTRTLVIKLEKENQLTEDESEDYETNESSSESSQDGDRNDKHIESVDGKTTQSKSPSTELHCAHGSDDMQDAYLSDCGGI